MTDREALELLYDHVVAGGKHREFPAPGIYEGTCEEDGLDWPCPVELVRRHLNG